MPHDNCRADAARDEAEIRQLLKHIEEVFDAGDLDAETAVFAPDAMILGQGAADIVGRPAVKKAYGEVTAQDRLRVRFKTEEIETFGDTAYERGTYTLTVTDKASGRVLDTSVNRHIHIFKRGADGAWHTWRMMTNSPRPAAGS